MIEMISRKISRQRLNNISQSEIFAVVVDGTERYYRKRVKRKESICVRHVFKMLNVHEEIMGLCELTSNMTAT